jgi:hypothetical protein
MRGDAVGSRCPSSEPRVEARQHGTRRRESRKPIDQPTRARSLTPCWLYLRMRPAHVRRPSGQTRARLGNLLADVARGHRSRTHQFEINHQTVAGAPRQLYQLAVREMREQHQMPMKPPLATLANLALP